MVRKHFGTDGIRGLANKVITPELAMKVAPTRRYYFNAANTAIAL